MNFLPIVWSVGVKVGMLFTVLVYKSLGTVAKYAPDISWEKDKCDEDISLPDNNE